MTELYFVRHAHADYSEDEYHCPLSLKGMRDVERVTSFFNDQRIDAIYSCPYKRAIQTVQGIARYHDVPIQTIDALKERTLSNGAMGNFRPRYNEFGKSRVLRGLVGNPISRQ